MNAAHFHLVINHFPVVLMLVSVAIGMHAQFRKSPAAKGIALALTMAASLFALPTYFSGEPAADFLENAAIVNDMHIEEHEEAAEKAVVVTSLSGLVAAAAYFLATKKSAHADRAFIASTVLALASTAVLGWTGSKGGVIRHPEVNEKATGAVEGPRASNHGEGVGTGSDIEESGDQDDVETEFEATPGRDNAEP
jgi:hypothetical protein